MNIKTNIEKDAIDVVEYNVNKYVKKLKIVMKSYFQVQLELINLI